MWDTVRKYVWKISKPTRAKLSRLGKWGFWGLLSLYGPGPMIAIMGVKGFLAAGAVTQFGLIEYL